MAKDVADVAIVVPIDVAIDVPIDVAIDVAKCGIRRGNRCGKMWQTSISNLVKS
jgi:hypothetical protein